jgi:hypothetical protein
MTALANTQADYAARISRYHKTMQLANQTADLCQQWADEYLSARDYWQGEAKHAALLLHLALLKKWGGYNAPH